MTRSTFIAACVVATTSAAACVGTDDNGSSGVAGPGGDVTDSDATDGNAPDGDTPGDTGGASSTDDAGPPPTTTGSSTTGAADEGSDSEPGSSGTEDCDADLPIDPENCGACGHSCLGGECVGGVCEPFVLYEHFTGYKKSDFAFAMDEDYVFLPDWQRNEGGRECEKTRLLRIDKDDGEATELVNLTGTSNSTWIPAIDVDHEHVYFAKAASADYDTDHHGIAKIPKQGGEPIMLAQDTWPDTIVVDPPRLFWRNRKSPIQSVDLDGTNRTVLGTASGGWSGWFAKPLAVYQNHLYTRENVDSFGKTNRIVRLPKAGGALSDIGDLQPHTFAIAVDDTGIYILNHGNDESYNKIPNTSGSLVRVDHDGSNEMLLADGLSWPSGVVLDDEHAYFLETGSARRVPKDGGVLESLGPSGPFEQGGTIAVDDKAIYWVRREPGICSGQPSWATSDYLGTLMGLAK